MVGYTFLGIFLFFQVIQVVDVQLFIVVSYDPLHFCMISCNVPNFITDFIYLSLPSSFLSQFCLFFFEIPALSFVDLSYGFSFSL